LPSACRAAQFQEKSLLFAPGFVPPLSMRKRPARRAGLIPSGRALSGIDFGANKKQRAALIIMAASVEVIWKKP
jgi:hypothetical protein